MKASNKIINIIYQIIFGNSGSYEFFSLNETEKDFLIETIFKSRAHFLLYKLLKENKNSENHALYIKTKEIVNFYTLHSIIHLEESHRLNKILKNNKIKFVFLKGVHLINSFYDDLTERPIRDIDILVNRKDIKRIVHILKKNGYSFEYDVDESSLDYFLMNSYDIPVLIGKNGSRLEVHFSIENSSHTKDCIFTERFLKDAQNIKYGSSCSKFLADEDLILHLIYHGLKKSGPNVGIIFIYDVYKVLLSSNYVDSILIQKAHIYNLTHHLKIVVELLCSQSNEKKLHELNKKIDYPIEPKVIKSLNFLFIRNDIPKEDIKLFKMINKLQFKKIINNFTTSSLQREYGIDKNNKLKIIFSYLFRMFRHLKILSSFTFKIIFFKSFRFQFAKIRNIMNYIDNI